MAPQLDETARFLYDCIIHSDYKIIDFAAMAKARGGTTKKHSLYCKWWAIHKAQGGGKAAKGEGRDDTSETAATTAAAKGDVKRKRGAGKGGEESGAKKARTNSKAVGKKVKKEAEKGVEDGGDGGLADGVSGEEEV